MKKTRLISITALLTFALLCIAPPMASAGDLGFKSVSQASFAVKGNPKGNPNWWDKFSRYRAKPDGSKNKRRRSGPPPIKDNPEPITGMLALAAAGIGGAAARKRKKQQNQD